MVNVDTICSSSNYGIQTADIIGLILRTIYSMSANPDAITMDAVGPHIFVMYIINKKTMNNIGLDKSIRLMYM